jgi:hypothetical protein
VQIHLEEGGGNGRIEEKREADLELGNSVDQFVGDVGKLDERAEEKRGKGFV